MKVYLRACSHTLAAGDAALVQHGEAREMKALEEEKKGEVEEAKGAAEVAKGKAEMAKAQAVHACRHTCTCASMHERTYTIVPMRVLHGKC